MAGPPDRIHLLSETMGDRKSLCLASSNPGFTLHRGDDGFSKSVGDLFNTNESVANEKMAILKEKLHLVAEDDFWSVLMESMTEILGAQYAICSKRILPGDERVAVEMPEAGSPGSCLTGLAFFCNDGSRERMQMDFDYETYGGPCAHMKHDKTFLISTGLSEFMTQEKRDTYFPQPMESYIGVPLFSNGKCFGHIGAFWTVKGAIHRTLSWGFIEMTMRALQDVIGNHVLEGRSFTKSKEPVPAKPATSLAAAMASLKPYARSLSHELRTPMHGVVGMLDIMHASIQDALEAPSEQDIVVLLRGLKENIETIQDSSKRAVEAADNVVHAYDLNMEVPDITAPLHDDDFEDQRGDISPTTSPIDARPISGIKRKERESDTDLAPSPKHRAITLDGDRAATPHTAALRNVVLESNQITSLVRPGGFSRSERDSSPVSPSTPGMKITRVREVIRLVVNESLRFGGRPDSAIATETEKGESIEVRNRSSNGEASTKLVEWSVDSSVPEEIIIDERDFAKLVSVMFLNALKFTLEGNVKVHVAMSSKLRYIVVTVTDTGAGIPAAFRPFLFKAFAREDDSLTRQNEGLGLGLMVAKAVARRVGGDLACVRSETDGPNRGSEFELRIPITPPQDNHSRQSSPSRAPTPLNLDGPQTPALSEVNFFGNGNSPRMLTRKLDDTESRPSITSVPANLYTSPSMRRDSGTTAISSDPRRPSLNRPSTDSVVATLAGQSTTVITTTPPTPTFDRQLAKKVPLNILVAEDNRINRKLLVNMLKRLGYTSVQEAFDGTEAVRLMQLDVQKSATDPGHTKKSKVDVVLMDLWMPNMDGYEAARRIFAMEPNASSKPKILAVSADVTDEALDKAKEVGMAGFMTKPYRMLDLERLLVQYCASRAA